MQLARGSARSPKRTHLPGHLLQGELYRAGLDCLCPLVPREVIVRQPPVCLKPRALQTDCARKGMQFIHGVREEMTGLTPSPVGVGSAWPDGIHVDHQLFSRIRFTLQCRIQTSDLPFLRSSRSSTNAASFCAACAVLAITVWVTVSVTGTGLPFSSSSYRRRSHSTSYGTFALVEKTRSGPLFACPPRLPIARRIRFQSSPTSISTRAGYESDIPGREASGTVARSFIIPSLSIPKAPCCAGPRKRCRPSLRRRKGDRTPASNEQH